MPLPHTDQCSDTGIFGLCLRDHWTEETHNTPHSQTCWGVWVYGQHSVWSNIDPTKASPKKEITVQETSSYTSESTGPCGDEEEINSWLSTNFSFKVMAPHAVLYRWKICTKLLFVRYKIWDVSFSMFLHVLADKAYNHNSLTSDFFWPVYENVLPFLFCWDILHCYVGIRITSCI